MKYLIKFGEEKYLKQCVENETFYFGRARTYIDIETKSLQKGQGDASEATLSLNADRGFMIDNSGDRRNINNVQVNVVVDDAADIPTYCISEIILDKHCVYTEKGYRLSTEFLALIREHFPNADSAIIIEDVDDFIENFRQKKCAYSESIKYFKKLEAGLSLDYISAVSSRLTKEEYEKSEMNNIINFKSELGDGTFKYYAINRNNSYKVLFAKDEFFSNQSEYRFVLPNNRIQTNGEEYRISGTKKNMKLISINELESYYFPRGGE